MKKENLEYMKFENTGEIEVQALTLLGASVKIGGGVKIGKFGTGFKFALAYFLRNEYDIRIFSGNTEIKIDTVNDNFRSRE